MTKGSPGENAPPLKPYDDVQVELAALCFDRLMPTLVSGGLTVLLVCAVLTVHYHSRWFLQLTAVFLFFWVLRLRVAFRFPAHRLAEMSAAAARRWEDRYGYATVVYVTVSAIVTASTRHQRDSVGLGLCTLGTFAFINGIGARVSIRPSVAKTSGLVLMVGLAIALLGSPEPLMRCSVGFLVLYAYIYCESIDIKYDVLVEQLRLKRKMSDLAGQDVLTGLANRREFYARLAKACVEPALLAVLYLDLDGFKNVNDTHGHATGDTLLQQVALRLQAIAPDALIARLGGDEFAVLHRSADGLVAEEVATRINAAIAEPFMVHGHSLRIGASIGIELSGTGSADPDTLLSKADAALYCVKRAGGGSFRFAEPSTMLAVAGPAGAVPAAQGESSRRGEDSSHRLGKLFAGVGEQQTHLPHLRVT